MRHASLTVAVAILGIGLFVFSPRPSLRGQLAMAEQERKVILMAAKDLQIGTTFNSDNLSRLFRKKLVANIDVPPNAIFDLTDIIGKTVVSNCKADVAFDSSKIKQYNPCGPGPDKHLYTMRLYYEQIGPWVCPGKSVNVTCTHRHPETGVIQNINLLRDLPVLSVDIDGESKWAGSCRPSMITITIACSLEESFWLQTAQDAKSMLRFLVIHERSEPFPIPSAEERYTFFGVANLDK